MSISDKESKFNILNIIVGLVMLAASLGAGYGGATMRNSSTSQQADVSTLAVNRHDRELAVLTRSVQDLIDTWKEDNQERRQQGKDIAALQKDISYLRWAWEKNH